uniref:Solute carrier family 40 member n=1 Tax=Panagrolaimus sp. PS1159 TaxID=55785 RepID=A0AC35FU07_9BILA
MAFKCISRPSKPFQLLYLGYIISCIGDRLWTFAIIFVLQRLGGMRLVGINQLFESVSAMFLASYVGNWLDRHNRRKGALTVLAVNNISVAISAALLAVCLSIPNSSILYVICLVLSILFCSLSKCASEGERMAFTKDWIVVMAQIEGGNTLSSRNATMTTIDQLSSVIAPLLTGVITEYSGHKTACFIFVIWNLLSWIIERYILTKVYSKVTALHSRQKRNIENENEIKIAKNHKNLSDINTFCDLFRAYFHQKIFSCAFGLALLYMTVLGFDGLAISHGKAQGVPEDVLGIFRSIGSALGIAGALFYTVIEQKVGPRKTGLFGLIVSEKYAFDPFGYANEWTFNKWLTKFLSSIYISPALNAGPNENSTFHSAAATAIIISEPSIVTFWNSFTFTGPMSSIIVFFCGITFARLGLWMADLSITQIMQEQIPEEERNTIFGVQNGLCQFFSVLKDIVVILLPSEKTFGFLIIMSVTFVFIGFLFYCFYMLKTRNQKRFTKSQPESNETELKALSQSLLHSTENGKN